MPLLFFALFLGVPIIEISLFITIGGRIGLAWTIFLVLATAVIGTYLIRLQGLATLGRAQRRLEEGEAPVQELFDGVCILIAGCLLVTPGFFTDTIGFVLLFPPLRRWAAAFIVPHLLVRARFRATGFGFRGGGGPEGGRGDVIDGEFVVVDPQEAQDQDDERSLPKQ